MPRDELVYVASPYSHDDPWVREERYKQVLHYVMREMDKGRVMFSPIVHTHHIGRILAKDHEFWMRQDFPLLRASSKLEVLMLDGWKYSRGIKDELDEAEKRGIPVEFIKPQKEMP